MTHIDELINKRSLKKKRTLTIHFFRKRETEKTKVLDRENIKKHVNTRKH